MRNIYVSIEGYMGLSFIVDDGEPNFDGVVTIHVDIWKPDVFATTCVELLESLYGLGCLLPNGIFMDESVCPVADKETREAIQKAFPTVTLGNDLGVIYHD